MRSLRRLLCAVAALFLALPCAYSAESPAASAPAPTAFAPQEAGQNTPEKTPTIQVQSNLVLVDVVVTKNGTPVKGLAKEKFHVLENGKEQELKVFEEHTEETLPTAVTNAAPASTTASGTSSAGNPSVAPAPKPLALPPNTYSDFAPPSPSSAVYVLLLDAANTLLTDQGYLRKEVLAYLKKVPPGTRMAVFSLSSRLRMVQGFTADPNVLIKAITDKDTLGASLADAKQTSWEAQEEAVFNMVMGQGQSSAAGQISVRGQPSASGQPGGLGGAISVQQLAAEQKSFYTDQQEEVTLEALRQLARYLGTIPGRKSLLWFSGAFPLNIDPVAPDSRINMSDPVTGRPVLDYCTPDSSRTTRNYYEKVRETDRMLTASRVAVYPIDAAGLLGENSFNASTSQASVECLASNAAPQEQTRQITTFQMQVTEEHHNQQATMQQVAEDTGGRAFVNSNDFQAAMQQALTDGANYYTIGYMPEGRDDGQFRHIKVKMEGGYELDYRDGYYADKLGRGPGSAATAMREAVEFGAPPPSEIPFKVRVIPASDPAAQGFTPAAGRAGAAKNLKAPVTRYLIDYMVDAHSFAFSKTDDGAEHARLEFNVLAYDADGKMINLTEHAFGLDLPPDIYAQVMSSGFPQHQEIDLPAGQVVLRIVVHDLGSSKAGATEVPLTVAKK